MKKTIVTLGLVVGAVVLAWVLYPTGLAANQKTFAPVSPEEFSQIRRRAMDFNYSMKASGLSLRTGDAASNSVQFNCGSVPLATILNGEQALVVMRFHGSERRAPQLAGFLDGLTMRLVPTSGEQSGGGVRGPNAAEAFVLKHRDGIDLSEDCSKPSEP